MQIINLFLGSVKKKKKSVFHYDYNFQCYNEHLKIKAGRTVFVVVEVEVD